MFQLTEEEKREVVANCDHLMSLTFSPVLPFAFIQRGPPALRAGASICGTPLPHTAPDHYETLRELIAAMRSLIAPPQQPKTPVGFRRTSIMNAKHQCPLNYEVPSSFSISSMVGREPLSFLGRRRVSWYSLTPMALLIPRRAYSAISLFFSWQRMRPMLG